MRFKPAAMRLTALFGLAVCAAILADSLSSSPAFCAFRSGCDEVIFSPNGKVLGVPLPVIGLVAFGAFFALTLVPGRAAALVGPAAVLAGLAGLTLIAVQRFVLRQTCPLCLLADASALALAAVQLSGRTKAAPPSSGRRLGVWSGAAALAFAGPLLWAWLRPAPPVPPEVRSLWVPGKVAVVEVTDFECRFCRQNEPVLAVFLEEHPNRVRHVRLVMPSPKHPNARNAALACLCAEAQGKGEAMAAALYDADDLSPEACRRLAETAGVDLKAFDACPADPAAEAKIDATSAWVQATGERGLPLVWVGDQMLVGAQTPGSLRAAYRRAEQH
jgi:uncharacterized membrane protein